MSIRLTGAGLLLVAAAIVLDSGPMFFLGGCLLVARWGALLWLRVIIGNLSVRRSDAQGGDGPLLGRAFFGGEFTIDVRVHNGAPLSVPWLRLRETLPPALILPNYRLEVAGMPPYGEHLLRYRLAARQRGLHAVGPLYLTLGDPLSLEERVLVAGEAGYLLVYPRVMPLASLHLPTAALLGTLRARRPLAGDPSRFAGVRRYLPGDPTHDIHWRATAATGRLQVRQYDPATETQTMLFLDLDTASYSGRGWRAAHAAELAITCAASLAWALDERRQAVGLVSTGALAVPPARTSGPDVEGDLLPLALLAREPAPSEAPGTRRIVRVPGGVRLVSGKGRGQTMRLLESLARLDVCESKVRFTEVVLDEAARLAWGATAVVITGAVGDGLWAALHRLREAGARVQVILVDEGGGVAAARAAATPLGIALWAVWHEADLETGPA